MIHERPRSADEIVNAIHEVAKGFQSSGLMLFDDGARIQGKGGRCVCPVRRPGGEHGPQKPTPAAAPAPISRGRHIYRSVRGKSRASVAETRLLPVHPLPELVTHLRFL